MLPAQEASTIPFPPLRPILVTVVAILLTLAGAAHAQTGGTLVLGLDQEPPTLDPHASPSAVTYQIIASVTECLLWATACGTSSIHG